MFGLLIFIPAIMSLLLALQWGGSSYPWNNSRIIALTVLFSVLGIVFIAFEYGKVPKPPYPSTLSRRAVSLQPRRTHSVTEPHFSSLRTIYLCGNKSSETPVLPRPVPACFLSSWA